MWYKLRVVPLTSRSSLVALQRLLNLSYQKVTDVFVQLLASKISMRTASINFASIGNA